MEKEIRITIDDKRMTLVQSGLNEMEILGILRYYEKALFITMAERNGMFPKSQLGMELTKGDSKITVTKKKKK